jgi:methylmalonyl-CoA mutase
MEYLTDMVEEAVYREFESISERGGTFGAMETMYQRGKIQEESLYYETLKHDGRLPIVGVNTFLSDADAAAEHKEAALIRSTEQEKEDQVSAVRAFRQRNAQRGAAAIEALQEVAARGGNVFGELMNAVKCCSLGQITRGLYAVGGQYRRNV